MQLAHRLFADQPDVFVHEVDPREVVPGEVLLDDEAAAISQAILSRRQQYAAGRLCVRRSLAQLDPDARVGFESFALCNDDERVPVFPAGIVGTITHTKWWAAAAVARTNQVRSVGLDIEPSTPLKANLFSHVMTAPELETFAAIPDDANEADPANEADDPGDGANDDETTPLAHQRGRLAKLLFSAKECAYKCQFMISRQFYGFHGMRVELDLERNTFDAIYLRDAAPFVTGDVLRGRFLFDHGYVMTSMVLT